MFAKENPDRKKKKKKKKIALLEKWKQTVDNGGDFGALMADLSKAFDCL